MACVKQLSACPVRSARVQAFHTSRAAPKHVNSICRCQTSRDANNNIAQLPIRLGAAAGLMSLGMAVTQPSFADLNKYEAAAGGEFNVGTAMQYGEAELRGKDFSGQVWGCWQVPSLVMHHALHLPNTSLAYSTVHSQESRHAAQDLRRSNFTSADARNANFAGAKLQGCYFIKAVTANANFQVQFFMLKLISTCHNCSLA